MWRVRVLGVLSGAAVTISLMISTEALAVSALNSYLYDFFAVERPGGVTSFTGRAWGAYTTISTSLALAVVLLSFFLGGVPAGLVARVGPGLNAALGSLAVVVIGFVWLVATFLPLLTDPASNPGEAYTRSENLQMSLLWGTAFCIVAPLGVLAGFVGGKLGGWFGNNPTADSESR